MSQLADPSLAAQFERQPPHNIEAEMCLIASMMLDKNVIGEAVQITSREAFYQADHQIIYSILVELWEKGAPIDAVILRGELVKRQLLDEVGGVDYLRQILESVPSAAHAPRYAKDVQDKYLLRSLIAVSNDNLRAAYAPHEDATEVVNAAVQRTFQMAERKLVHQLAPVGPVAEEVYANLEQPAHGDVPTGFHDLDDMFAGGLHNGEFVIVAARPSIGKTAYAAELVISAAYEQGLPTAVFSMEMNKEQFVQRMICALAGVDAQKVRKRMMNQQEWHRVADVTARLGAISERLWLDDTPTLTTLDVLSKLRKMRMRAGLKLIVLDYLQLMDAEGESRQQQITTISRGLKAIAREMNVPLVALSQLNRQVESREGHRPRMSDLRESGSLEQDADTVMLLHREDYYRQTSPDFVPDNLAEVIVAKQRNGPVGTVKLTFDPRCTRFRNLAAQVDVF
jgi:replicative DNA helicase